MIEVRVRKNEIKVSGHAMYAPHGQDIVCAGVSSLVRTLIRSIEDLTRHIQRATMLKNSATIPALKLESMRSAIITGNCPGRVRPPLLSVF